jgi:hypothetical protein
LSGAKLTGLDPLGAAVVSPKQLDERVQVSTEHVFAAEIADDPLLVLAVFAIALDETDVFVLDTLAATSLDDAEEHRYCHGTIWVAAATVKHILQVVCHYVLLKIRARLNRLNPLAPAAVGNTTNMG